MKSDVLQLTLDYLRYPRKVSNRLREDIATQLDGSASEVDFN